MTATLGIYDAIAATKTVDLLSLIGNTTKLRKVSAREYAGPCPKCGGRDRFRVNLDRGWFCRQCQGEDRWHDAIDWRMWIFGERLTQAVEALNGGRKLDRGTVERLALERSQAEQARRDEEVRELAAARDRLHRSRVWETYHNNMDDRARELWRARGIPDDWQDYCRLGYCPPREWRAGDEVGISDSLAIPYLRYIAPSRYTCIGLKHRILAPDFPGGKYRPEFSGLGNELYFPLHEEPILPRALIIEGEIKAMVVQIALYSLDPCPNITVVGHTGKAMKAVLLSEFSACERIWIVPDPDAAREGHDMAAALGADRCKIINLPGKVDDLITAGVIDGHDLYCLLDVV